jgi:hypothetical protein
VVDVWCGLIDHMDRPALDAFTRDIWRRFDPADLEPLKRAILSATTPVLARRQLRRSRCG